MLLSATLHKAFGRRVVLRDAQLSLRRGEVLALMGPSGSGKSTLAGLIAGVLEPDTKSLISLEPGTTLSFAAQEPELAEWRTVRENVTFEADLVSPGGKANAELVHELLSAVGLAHRADAFPAELSVGMRQRLQMCRSLYRSADVYVFDEPLSAVDEATRNRIAKWVRTFLVKSGRSAIWITHDSREALAVGDRLALLRYGQLAEVAVSGEDQTRWSGHPMFGAPAGSDPVFEEELSAVESAVELSSNRLSRWLVPGAWPALLVGAALIGLWHLSSSASPANAFYISSPQAVGQSLIEHLASGAFWFDVGLTSFEASTGLVIGVVGGGLLGIFAAGSRVLMLALRPYLVALTAVPVFVLAPAFIVWFGVGLTMKIALAALSAAPIIALATLQPVEQEATTFARYLMAQGVPRRRAFLRFVLPKGILALLNSLRPAAIASLLGAFLGEFISAERGLGYFILLNASRYHMEDVLVGALVLGILALVASALTSIAISKRTALVRTLRL